MKTPFTNENLTLCAAALAAAGGLSACAFPNDGTRDDVLRFDARDDLATPDADDGATSIDAATDASRDATSIDASQDAADARAPADANDGATADVAMCPADAGPSLQLCGGACTDTSRNAAHCGRCDNPCGLGTECIAGACNLRCSPGTVRCGTECIDPTSNPEYCNANDTCTTFTRCMAGQSCADGRCIANCAPGSIVCGGRCVDPTNDPQFCGARTDCAGPNAGTRCMGAQVCARGTCALTCPMGTLACGGSCIAPLNDRAHCGATGDCMGANAGVACTAGQVCVNGRCSAGGCATGTIRCGDSCVDPSSNRDYCGARGDCAGTNVGVRCAASEQCLSGLCLYTPPPQSYLARAIDPDDVWSPDHLTLSLGAPLPGTFYYTLDGSLPTPGAVNTVAATGRTVTVPRALGAPMGMTSGCTQVRWFVDYGRPYGRETVVHSRQICSNTQFRNTNLAANRMESPFTLTSFDEVSIESAGVVGGPVVIASPGQPVALRFRLRQYPPAGLGDRQALVFVEDSARRTVFCQFTPTPIDTRWSPTNQPALQFAAPSTPGRYAIRWNHAAINNCRVPSPLELRTVAVLIVR